MLLFLLGLIVDCYFIFCSPLADAPSNVFWTAMCWQLITFVFGVIAIRQSRQRSYYF